MRGLASVLLVLVLLSLFSFMAVSVSNNKTDVKEKPRNIEFKTFTSAVCDNSSELIKCKDELFVN